jgi:hypothetical protein
MEVVKKKWQKFKTYRRVRKLWNEYKAVAQIESKDISIVWAKLNAFLDDFVVSYKDFANDPNNQGFNVNLDKIYGDCSQILLSLLDVVEKEAEKGPNSQESLIADLINKALSVAELILRDEKYRLIVKETPNLINRIVSLLDSLSTVESKKVVLRVIAVLGETIQNQLELGRVEGFRKMLKLLFSEDRELTKEILKTIKHLIDVQQINAPSEHPQIAKDSSEEKNSNEAHRESLTSSSSSSISNPSLSAQNNLVNNASLLAEDANSLRKNVSTTFLSGNFTLDSTIYNSMYSLLLEFFTGRIGTVLSDVSKLVVYELHKVFPSTQGK